MAVYDEQPGAMAGAGAMAAAMRRRMPGRMGKKRRMAPPMGGMPGGGMRLPIPGMPPQQVDPGFQINPGMGGGPMEGNPMEDIMRQKMQQQNSVTWGGKTWSDPNKLWGWIAGHRSPGVGGTGSQEDFWRLHPDAARRLGMPVEGEQEEIDPMDPNGLRKGLVNQMSMAQGALSGADAPGVHKVANRRMRAVGAAQGRAAALAKVMARRLRGRPA